MPLQFVTGISGGYITISCVKNICESFLNKFDLTSLCETWSENNNIFELDGYVYLYIYRTYKHPSAKRGSGGIGIYSKSNIYRKGVELYRSKSDAIAWVKLKKTSFGYNKDILLGIVYLPPENSTSNTVDAFTIFYEELSSLPHNVDTLICGDFNSRTSNLPDYFENVFHEDSEGDLWPQL